MPRRSAITPSAKSGAARRAENYRKSNRARFPPGAGTVLAELTPTPKIIWRLRGWFPRARLVGWKYELEGDRAQAIHLAEKQMADNQTDACVVNGLAYGAGCGLVTGPGRCRHLPEKTDLFEALADFPKIPVK